MDQHPLPGGNVCLRGDIREWFGGDTSVVSGVVWGSEYGDGCEEDGSKDGDGVQLYQFCVFDRTAACWGADSEAGRGLFVRADVSGYSTVLRLAVQGFKG